VRDGERGKGRERGRYGSWKQAADSQKKTSVLFARSPGRTKYTSNSEHGNKGFVKRGRKNHQEPTI